MIASMLVFIAWVNNLYIISFVVEHFTEEGDRVIDKMRGLRTGLYGVSKLRGSEYFDIALDSRPYPNQRNSY